MEFNIEQQQEISKLFNEMNSKLDFLTLLNFTKQILYGIKSIPFEEKQLNYYINKEGINSTRVFYTSFAINKKSGGERIIHAPVKGLKEFQKVLNLVFQCVYIPHKSATGFVVGKSIVDNAKVHVNQNYVYNLDLKDFFPSIDKSRVWGRLLVAPFNLGNSPERKKIANMIAILSSTPMEVERCIDGEWQTKTISVLPQGAPTSPSLTNAICEKLDIRLNGVAKRFGLNYSRYADDITFSSNHNSHVNKKGDTETIYTSDSSFNEEVRRIISEQNFHIKESKVRLQKRGYRQEVTGVIVNEKINVNQKYIKQLRQWIFFWESYGYERANLYFLKSYIAAKGHVKKGKPSLINVIDGKLLYLKMIKGDDDTTYSKLKERFDALYAINSPINSILDIWEKEGIEKAIEVYYSKNGKQSSDISNLEIEQETLDINKILITKIL